MQAHIEYGDVVTLPLNGRSVVAAFGAEQVSAVTAAYGREVEISPVGGVELKALKTSIQGRGPLNTTGAEHASYRRVSLRALGGESAKSYAAITTDLTQRLLDGWRVGAEAELIQAITPLTRRIFKYYMFGSDIAVTDRELDAAVELYISVMSSGPRRLGASLFSFDIPGLSRGATLRRGLALVDSRVAAIAAGGGTPRFSLAESILRQLEHTGVGADPALARELMLQLYFAGISSVASTIVWALLLLALHPEPARRLVDELDRELGGNVPQETLTSRPMPELDALLEETMRLYPAAAYEFKRTEDELVLDDCHVPANTPLLLAPWVTQRSPGSFDDPESFRPERFTARRRTYPKGAFTPWGTGSRSCVGRALGQIAMRTIVGGIVGRYRLDLLPRQRIDPDPGPYGIRLLPRPGVRVRMAGQDGETERSAAAVAGTIVGGVPGPISLRR
jgi:cytochrome P450